MKRNIFVFMMISALLAAAGAAGKQESKAGPVVITGMVRDYTLQQDAPWATAIKVSVSVSASRLCCALAVRQ